jgi:uncharacterized membrane protein YadS
VLRITLLALVVLIALAGAAEAWLLRRASVPERLLMLAAGLVVLFAHALRDRFFAGTWVSEGHLEATGVVLLGVAIAIQLAHPRRPAVS